MIDRRRFVEEGRPRWEALEAHLNAGPPSTGEGWSQLAAQWRALCADLSRARSLDLPADTTAWLDGLAARTHDTLYGVRPRGGASPLALLLRDVPRELRAEWRLLLLSAALFFIPMLLGCFGALESEAFATRVLPQGQLDAVESMYRDPQGRGGFANDVSMTGFYVYNNIGIAFRCFATGALFGAGSVFYLAYNGLVLGVVFGHLVRVGSGGNLISFVVSHGPWELLAIVVAGAAGLRLGWSLVVTNGLRRMDSLRLAGPGLFRLVTGAAAMLAVAALIEGLWSAGPAALEVKVGVGVAGLVLIGVWAGLGGRT